MRLHVIETYTTPIVSWYPFHITLLNKSLVIDPNRIYPPPNQLLSSSPASSSPTLPVYRTRPLTWNLFQVNDHCSDTCTQHLRVNKNKAELINYRKIWLAVSNIAPFSRIECIRDDLGTLSLSRAKLVDMKSHYIIIMIFVGGIYINIIWYLEIIFNNITHMLYHIVR